MMRRTCDWCREDAVFSYLLPVPAGAVTPDDYVGIDFCHMSACTDNAVQHLARITADRPYPTAMSFVVIGV